LTTPQGVRVRIDGRELINFSSNDYLNYASDPRLAQAASGAARRHGTGAGASPLVSGLTTPLRQLERDLAVWEGTESALVFSSGYTANLAVISSLAGPEDAVFSDQLNHASLIDGCRLSRAGVHVYQHADMDHLDKLLKQHQARRRLIVSDSVFSMDGDIAPLAELLTLAERHDALLILDEAHATGVLGQYGRGVSEQIMIDGRLDPTRLIKVGTLSKALGSQGGFVCGSQRLRTWLVNRARPYIFSTALAPPVAAAARCAVALVRQEAERRNHLLAMADWLRTQLRNHGYSVGGSCCQIVPLIIGSARDAVELSRQLQERGFLVPAIRPPSVPDGTARLRISLTAGLSQEDLIRLVSVLDELRARRGL
jgi:8-amino-7-oxononanoate synthase